MACTCSWKRKQDINIVKPSTNHSSPTRTPTQHHPPPAPAHHQVETRWQQSSFLQAVCCISGHTITKLYHQLALSRFKDAYLLNYHYQLHTSILYYCIIFAYRYRYRYVYVYTEMISVLFILPWIAYNFFYFCIALLFLGMLRLFTYCCPTCSKIWIWNLWD